MIKAIIFDCFGVLVGGGFDETYSLMGGDPKKDKAFINKILDRANRGEMPQREFRKLISDRLSISLKEYELAVQKAEQPNIRLLEYINYLKKKYKTAVLSNANVGVIERKLDSETIEKSFDAIVVSAEVGYMKPDKEIYELTADRLGVSCEECIFVDDRMGYIIGANKVGMKTIFYKGFEDFKHKIDKILAL